MSPKSQLSMPLVGVPSATHSSPSCAGFGSIGKQFDAFHRSPPSFAHGWHFSPSGQSCDHTSHSSEPPPSGHSYGPQLPPTSRTASVVASLGSTLLLPRQQRAHGEHAWIVHGLGWLLFHVAFGPSMMIVTAPLIVAQSRACQRTGNTTVGIAIHGGVNGLGFLTIALIPM